MRNDGRIDVVAGPSSESSSWCTKIFEYVKNRNRVCPAKVELADCDFFVVGPRRTLRVLVRVPPPRVCDEKTSGDRSVNEISDGTDRLGTSDRNEENRAVKSLDNGGTSSSVTIAESGIKRETRNHLVSSSLVLDDDDGAVKSKIVKDLEKYIERLLREVLSDTMRLFNDAGDENSHEVSRENSAIDENEIIKSDNTNPEERDSGCVNRGFSGSADDPDSLDIRPALTADSSEPSLEESLMEIMDAKFGRGPTRRDWKKNNVSMDADDDRDEISKDSTAPDISLPAGNDEIKTDVIEDKTSIVNMLDEQQQQRESSQRNVGQPTRRRPAVKSFKKEISTKKLVNPRRRRFNWKFSTGDRRAAEKTNGATTTSDAAGRENNVAKFDKFRKPVIVFLHGFGSSAEIFDNQLEYFSNHGYPCIAPELLGHGMSSAPDRSKDYRFDRLFEDLEMVLGHYVFRSGRKCVLVAHNYGCSFATALARKYESDVHRLVLISGGGPTPLAPPITEGPIHCFLRAVLTPLLVCGLGRDILYRSARGRQHPYCGSEQTPRSHMKHVLNGMIWPEGDHVFHRGITIPALLIHGLRDDSVSLVQECQMERTMIKAFLDAIPTAGRAPMIDRPERVNRAIHRFIDRSSCKRSSR